MTSPKKRLTLADVNKKVDIVDRAQKSSRQIRDVEVRHIREQRNSIHQRLDDLEGNAVNDRELLFSQEDLISEGHEIAALDKKVSALDGYTQAVDRAQKLTGEIADAHMNTMSQHRSAVHTRLEDLEKGAEVRTAMLKRLEDLEREADVQTTRTDQQNQIKALEHCNSNRMDEIKHLERIVANAYAKAQAGLSNVHTVLDTLGPLWKTRAGHTRPIALLSTSHLKALQSGTVVYSPATSDFIREELARRTEDKKWRVAQGDSEEQSQEERFSKLEATRLVQVSLNSSNAQRLKKIERRVKQNERDIYDGLPEETDREDYPKAIEARRSSIASPSIATIEDISVLRTAYVNLMDENGKARNRLLELETDGRRREKRLDAHGKDINRLKSDKFAVGGVVYPHSCKFDFKKPTNKTVYVDAFGNCTDTLGNPVEPSVAGQISDIKDDVKELQLDLNQQHSMIDIYGNRLDKLENNEDLYEKEHEIGEDTSCGDDFIAPLIFPKGSDKITYTITRGRKNGTPFITYGDVKIEAPKRSFFHTLFSFLRLGK